MKTAVLLHAEFLFKLDLPCFSNSRPSEAIMWGRYISEGFLTFGPPVTRINEQQVRSHVVA
jgi:hypothetical protein